MRFSERCWRKSAKLVEAIKSHPFNQELKEGTLDAERFSFYIGQDLLWLKDCSRAHALVASRVAPQYQFRFLNYAEFTLIAEQEILRKFFCEKSPGTLSPSNLSFTSFLLKTAALESVEVAASALIACMWVYREVGSYIVEKSSKGNPYDRWIATYSSRDFGRMVEEALSILDEMAEKASPKLLEQMEKAFYTATCFEWHFWNDAYDMRLFDSMTNKPVKLAR